MPAILTRDEIFRNIELAQRISNEGVSADRSVLGELDYDNTYLEQIYGLFNLNHVNHKASKLPDSFRSPSGFRFSLCFDPASKEFSITKEDGKYFLNREGKQLFEIFFEKKPRMGMMRRQDVCTEKS
jgi:hypothetical protein